MTPQAAYLYRKLVKRKRYYTFPDGEMKVICFNSIPKSKQKACQELIDEGYITKCSVGKRHALQLGTFSELMFKDALSIDKKVKKLIEVYPKSVKESIMRAFDIMGLDEAMIYNQLTVYSRYPVSVVAEAFDIFFSKGYDDDSDKCNTMYLRGIMNGVVRNRQKADSAYQKETDRQRSRKMKLEKHIMETRQELADVMIEFKKREYDGKITKDKLEKIVDEVYSVIEEREKHKGKGYWLIENTISKLRKML